MRVPPQEPAGFGELPVHLRNIVADTQRLIGHGVHGRHIQIGIIGILEADTHPLHPLFGRRSHHIRGIRTGQQAVKPGGNFLPRQTFDEEGKCFGITQQLFPLRFRLSVQDGVGGQPEGMQPVLLHHGKPQLGSHEVDACRQVRHLQRAVGHLRAAQAFQQFAQLAIGGIRRKAFLPAYRQQRIIIFLYSVHHSLLVTRHLSLAYLLSSGCSTHRAYRAVPPLQSA